MPCVIILLLGQRSFFMARYIHLTDLHFWSLVCNPLRMLNKRALGTLNLLIRRRHQIKTERAAGLIAQFQEMDIDAFLIGGDLTTTATEEEFRQAADFLGRLTMLAPVYLVAGNHDVYTFESKRKERLEKYCQYWLPDEDTAAIDRLPGDVPLLRIPTVRPNLLSSRGSFQQDAAASLQTCLSEQQSQPMIVLAHYPFLPQTAAYHLGLNRGLGNGTTLRRILGGSEQPLLYLAGHVHVFSHTRDPEQPNLEQVTTRALFYAKKDRPGGFTEIQAAGAQFSVYPWVYRDGWQREALSSP